MATIQDGSELLNVLQRCCGAKVEPQERLAACEQLMDMVKSQRVRDVDELPRETYGLLFTCVTLGWQEPKGKMRSIIQPAFTGIIEIPEFNTAVAGDFIENGFLVQLCGRFQAGLREERLFLRDTLYWAYAKFPKMRGLLRRQIGGILSQFARTPSRNTLVAEVLQVVRQLIKGFQEPWSQVLFSLVSLRGFTKKSCLNLVIAHDMDVAIIRGAYH